MHRTSDAAVTIMLQAEWPPDKNFLMKVYNAMTRDPDLWAGTVMIITYDEHGGFFDHVSPIDLLTLPTVPATYEPFRTGGVRVPAFIVSPFVKPRDVYNEAFDHTSILKFIGDRFGINGAYGFGVDQRAVASISEVLDLGLEPVKQAGEATPQTVQQHLM